MSVQNTVRSNQNGTPKQEEVVPQPSTETSQEQRQDEPNLADRWKTWKRRSGSAQNSSRKLSSIDPLAGADKAELRREGEREGILTEEAPQEEDQQQAQEDRAVIEQTLKLNDTTAADADNRASWVSYINPLQYVPQDVFQPQNYFNQPHSQDMQSTYSPSPSTASSSPHPTPYNGWLSWFLPAAKSLGDSDTPHDLVTSTELKKSVKEAKKAIQSPDSVWAWYQNHYDSHSQHGEISVIGTKAETNPVELSRYPNTHHADANEVNNSKKVDEEILGTGEIIPNFNKNYRHITRKTKIRIAAQLYYNYLAENHLYIKKKPENPIIQYSLVISITGPSPKSKTATTASLNGHHLTEIATEAIKSWYTTNDIPYDHQIETISISSGKLNNDSLEDLFKLLINWREDFKKIQHLLIIGYNNTAPLSFALLDILISRNLFDNGLKFGLLSIDGVFPSPYSSINNDTDGSANATVPYLNSEEFEKICSRLIHVRNTKVSFIGTLHNLPVSLGLHLVHPNIFRSVYLPQNSYDDGFEKHLFKLLLTSLNLGHDSRRLLLQISKYFKASSNNKQITDDINKDFLKNTIDNTLRTTTLIYKRHVQKIIIDDPILTNDFNLIWTFHAFINDYKKLKNINSSDEIKSLLKLYKSWDPQSKSLKDLKYMLEVLRIDEYSGSIFT